MPFRRPTYGVKDLPLALQKRGLTLHCCGTFFAPESSDLCNIAAELVDNRDQLAPRSLRAPHTFDVGTRLQEFMTRRWDDHGADIGKDQTIKRTFYDIGHLGIRIQNVQRVQVWHEG